MLRETESRGANVTLLEVHVVIALFGLALYFAKKIYIIITELHVNEV